MKLKQQPLAGLPSAVAQGMVQPKPVNITPAQQAPAHRKDIGGMADDKLSKSKEQKEGVLKSYVSPTAPKILIYTILVFLAPTFFKICSGGVGDVCSWKLSFLAGYKLFIHQAPGKLTIPMILLLFFTSYLLSIWIVSTFNMLKRQQNEMG